MKTFITWRRVLLTTAGIAGVVGAYLVYALAGLGAQDVVYSAPPEFVASYAKQFANTSTSNKAELEHGATVQMTKDYAQETAIVHDVFFEQGSAEQLVQLFSHPEQVQRVKIALAFSTFNVKYTHDEASGFADKRTQFYSDYVADIDNIRNAHFEALIASAAEQTNNYIPYTIAWMPEQGQKTVEMLAWSAQHHSDWWVRRFSVFFVVQFGGNKELSAEILSSQTHDPDYRVRKEVLDQRIRLVMGS